MPALWRANQQSVVGHSLVAEGTENVVYDPAEGGEVGENLSPMNAEAQAIVDGQKSPHPDKTKAKPTRTPRAAPAAPSAPVAGEGEPAVGQTDGDIA